MAKFNVMICLTTTTTHTAWINGVEAESEDMAREEVESRGAAAGELVVDQTSGEDAEDIEILFIEEDGKDE